MPIGGWRSVNQAIIFLWLEGIPLRIPIVKARRKVGNDFTFGFSLASRGIFSAGESVADSTSVAVVRGVEGAAPPMERPLGYLPLPGMANLRVGHTRSSRKRTVPADSPYISEKTSTKDTKYHKEKYRFVVLTLCFFVSLVDVFLSFESEPSEGFRRVICVGVSRLPGDMFFG